MRSLIFTTLVLVASSALAAPAKSSPPPPSAPSVSVTDDPLPYLSVGPAVPAPNWNAMKNIKPRTPTLSREKWVSGGDAAPAPAPADNPAFAPAATPDWAAGRKEAKVPAAAPAAAPPKAGSTPAAAPKFLGSTSKLAFDDSRVPGMLTPTNAAGKLFICAAADGTTCTSAWVCSAALVGKGLLLTAAHCVWDYGTGAAFTKINGAIEVWFYPAKNGATNPYGAFRAKAITVPAPYAAGTDTCAAGAEGIVCNNDLALIALEKGGVAGATPVLAGDAVKSFFGVGVNNYGAAAPVDAGVSPAVAATFGTKVNALVAQLGYPAYIDAGNVMQVSFSPAYVYTASGTGAGGTSNGKPLRQLVKGTTMGGGASGGPWVVNLGVNGSAAVYGAASASRRNVIVGVSSWGYVGSTTDIDSIAMFGCSTLGTNAEYPNASYGTRPAGNIGKLMYDFCDTVQAGQTTTFKAQGLCP